MKKFTFLAVLMLTAFIIVACNGNKPSTTHNVSFTPQDTNLVSILLKNKEEIKNLWNKQHPKTKLVKYATAKNLIYLTSEDEQVGLLVHIHFDQNNTPKFSCIEKNAGQEVSLIGNIVKVAEKKSEKDMETTYYMVPNQEPIERLVRERMRGGGCLFENGDGFQMSADQAARYIEEITRGVEVPFNKELSIWKNI